MDTTKPSSAHPFAKKILKLSGGIIVVIGWIIAVLATGEFLGNFVVPFFSESGLNEPTFLMISVPLLMALTASLCIMLGRRVRTLVDASMAKYFLILLFPTSLFLFLGILANTDFIVGIIILLFLSIFSGMYAFKVCTKDSSFSDTLHHPEYTLNKKGWILFFIASILFLAVACFVDLYRLNNKGFSLPEGVSVQEFIEKAVLEAEADFPEEVSENLSVTGMTTEPGVLQYHYSMGLLDPENANYIKDTLISNACKYSMIRFLLEQEITVKYLFVVDNSEQNFIVSVIEADCLR